MATTGDSMDDPAVWVHPNRRSRSLVIGNNKRGALETYDLAGNRVQRIADDVTFWGNVDVRQKAKIAGKVRDIVAVYHRGLQLYRVNPSTRRLTRVNEGVAIPTAGEGLCLYKSRPSGHLYVFVVAISGMVRQFRIRDADRDGRLGAVEVRRFEVGSEAEGCVADDDRGVVYISEEEVGLWRYRAGPGVAPRRSPSTPWVGTWSRTSKASRSSTCPAVVATSSRRHRTSPTRTTRSSSSTTA